jgi:hypothetical protein
MVRRENQCCDEASKAQITEQKKDEAENPNPHFSRGAVVTRREVLSY